MDKFTNKKLYIKNFAIKTNNQSLDKEKSNIVKQTFGDQFLMKDDENYDAYIDSLKINEHLNKFLKDKKYIIIQNKKSEDFTDRIDHYEVNDLKNIINVPRQPIKSEIPRQPKKSEIPRQPKKSEIPKQPIKSEIPRQPIKSEIPQQHIKSEIPQQPIIVKSIDKLKNSERKFLLFIKVENKDRIKISNENKDRNFDILASCEWENDNIHKFVDYYFISKGSKFKDFYYFYKKNGNVLSKYKYISLFDNDIEINHEELTTMFEYCEIYKPLLAQPSYSNYKGFWDMLKTQEDCEFHYVDLIDMSIPFFEYNSLNKFFAYINDKIDFIQDYGIDMVYSWLLSDGMKNYKNRFLVLDIISATKPHKIVDKNNDKCRRFIDFCEINNLKINKECFNKILESKKYANITKIKYKNNSYDNIYVINMTKNKENRFDSFLKSPFSEIFNIYRFEAIRSDNGWIGCAMSHLYLIRYAKENNFPYIIVSEDDSIIDDENKSNLIKIIKALKNNSHNWDIFNGTADISNELEDNVIKIFDNIKFLKYEFAWKTNFMIYNNSSYDKLLYYLSMYEKMLKNYNSFNRRGKIKHFKTKMPIDHIINFIDLVKITHVPFVVKVPNNYSEIDKKVKNSHSSISNLESQLLKELNLF